MSTDGIADTPRFKSVTDLMDNVEAEISQLKNGELPESKARVVMRARALQFQGVALFLQAARMDRSLQVDVGSQIRRQKQQALPVAPVVNGEQETGEIKQGGITGSDEKR